jgi:hypothetical protein
VVPRRLGPKFHGRKRRAGQGQQCHPEGGRR